MVARLTEAKKEEIRSLVAKGWTNSKIAAELGISRSAVADHARDKKRGSQVHNPPLKPSAEPQLEIWIKTCQFIQSNKKRFTDKDKCGKPVCASGESYCLKHYNKCYVKQVRKGKPVRPTYLPSKEVWHNSGKVMKR